MASYNLPTKRKCEYSIGEGAINIRLASCGISRIILLTQQICIAFNYAIHPPSPMHEP